MRETIYSSYNYCNCYGPLFNLSDYVGGPLYLQGPLFAFEDLKESNYQPNVQRQLQLSLKEMVALENDYNENYLVQDPRDLHIDYQSEKWILMCEKINNFQSLKDFDQFFCIRLLNSLCFYQFVIECLSAKVTSNMPELNYELAVAKLMLSVDGYNEFPKNELKKMFLGMKTSKSALRAVITMIVHVAKSSKNIIELEEMTNLAITMGNEIEYLNSFDEVFWRNRILRATSMLNWVKADIQMVEKEMDECLQQAHYLCTIGENSGNQRLSVVAIENLKTVAQSASKSYIFSGSLDKGLDAINLKIKCDTLDPMSYVERAEIFHKQGQMDQSLNDYLLAAQIGAPMTVIANFMAGQIYRTQSKYLSAMYHNLLTLKLDPLADSAYEEIVWLSGELNLPLFLLQAENIRASVQSD